MRQAVIYLCLALAIGGCSRRPSPTPTSAPSGMPLSVRYSPQRLRQQLTTLLAEYRRQDVNRWIESLEHDRRLRPRGLPKRSIVVGYRPDCLHWTPDGNVVVFGRDPTPADRCSIISRDGKARRLPGDFPRRKYHQVIAGGPRPKVLTFHYWQRRDPAPPQLLELDETQANPTEVPLPYELAKRTLWLNLDRPLRPVNHDFYWHGQIRLVTANGDVVATGDCPRIVNLRCSRPTRCGRAMAGTALRCGRSR